MNILGIIPARAGSKRVSGKNVKLLCGRPLIEYAIQASVESQLLNRIVVSSDSDTVLSIAANYPSVCALQRPPALAEDNSPAIDYVRHALDVYQSKGEHFSHIVIIQPTSPLTRAEDIDNTIQLLLTSEADSAVSIMKLDHAIHPVKLKLLKGDVLLPYWEEEKGRMASFELPDLYVRNCAVYATTIEVVNKGKIIGDDCRGYLMPRERSIDINDPVDFDFAEFLMTKNRKNSEAAQGF